MTDEIMKPFYDYLEKERQALLTKLDSIERIMGVSPRTAELRKRHNNVKIKSADYAGVVQYDSE